MGASILLLGLLVLLFLYERKNEIGIYLALGERKIAIAFQLIFELLPLTLIGLTVAAFAGGALSDTMARQFVLNELNNPTNSQRIQIAHDLQNMGYRFVVSHDEMMVAFEGGISTEIIVIFYLVGVFTVITAGLFPIMKYVRMKPKNILN